MSDLTPNQERAAFHGVAMNRAYTTPVRIQAALQALELYEAEVEQLRNFIKALRNDEDYDPAPIVTEYDRVVEENARLFKIHEGWRDVIEKAKAVLVAWNDISMVDPDDAQIAAGYCSLLSVADSHALDDVFDQLAAAVDAMAQPEEPVALTDVVMPDGTHWYWSTHCRHGRHDACSADELAPGVPRNPAQCKTCAAPCICQCHTES